MFEIGARVIARWENHDRPGIITEVTRVHDGLDDAVYTVRGLLTDMWVGPEDIQSDPTPTPAVGQHWRTLLTGREATVLVVLDLLRAEVKVDGDRVCTVCLSSLGWELVSA